MFLLETDIKVLIAEMVVTVFSLGAYERASLYTP